MGSYITVCFAKRWISDTKFIKKCSQAFMCDFEHLSEIKYKYPADDNYSSWEEGICGIEQIPEILKKCCENENAEIIFDYMDDGIQINQVHVHVEKQYLDSIGIVFFIPEEHLLKGKILDEVENDILNYMVKKLSYFDYAFCDNEIDLECKFDYVISTDNVYSILVFNSYKKKNVKFAKWKIDGLTER